MRPSIQLAAARHLAEKLWGDEEVQMATRGVWQGSGSGGLVAFVGQADLAPPATEAARQLGFISSVMVVAARGEAVLVLGPSGLYMAHEWEQLLDGLEHDQVDAVPIQAEVWVAETEQEVGSLMIASASIRNAFADRLMLSEPDIRDRLDDLGCPYPRLLDDAVDELVQDLMREMA